jgi:hypothetical protein
MMSPAVFSSPSSVTTTVVVTSREGEGSPPARRPSRTEAPATAGPRLGAGAAEPEPVPRAVAPRGAEPGAEAVGGARPQRLGQPGVQSPLPLAPAGRRRAHDREPTTTPPHEPGGSSSFQRSGDAPSDPPHTRELPTRRRNPSPPLKSVRTTGAEGSRDARPDSPARPGAEGRIGSRPARKCAPGAGPLRGRSSGTATLADCSLSHCRSNCVGVR